MLVRNASALPTTGAITTFISPRQHIFSRRSCEHLLELGHRARVSDRGYVTRHRVGVARQESRCSTGCATKAQIAVDFFRDQQHFAEPIAFTFARAAWFSAARREVLDHADPVLAGATARDRGHSGAVHLAVDLLREILVGRIRRSCRRRPQRLDVSATRAACSLLGATAGRMPTCLRSFAPSYRTRWPGRR